MFTHILSYTFHLRVNMPGIRNTLISLSYSIKTIVFRYSRNDSTLELFILSGIDLPQPWAAHLKTIPFDASAIHRKR